MLNKDGTKSDFGGGMETFILTLAFKIALSEVFNSSKCGLLIIDGFQDYTIDKINIIKIKNKAKVMYI